MENKKTKIRAYEYLIGMYEKRLNRISDFRCPDESREIKKAKLSILLGLMRNQCIQQIELLQSQPK